MRETLIEFMDSLRDYVAESGTNIAHDERDSSEFVDIFLNQEQSLPIDSVVEQSEQLPEAEKLCRMNQNFVCNCIDDSRCPNF